MKDERLPGMSLDEAILHSLSQPEARPILALEGR